MTASRPGLAIAVAVAVAIAMSPAPLHAAPEVAPSLVGTRADPAVARAVADAAAALPVPARADATPDPQDRAFVALAKARRRCSPLEAAAKVAIVATCIRSLHCVDLPASADVRPLPPDCDVVKART